MNWLLIRGLVREKEHWGEFPKMLESVGGVKRVLCLDLAGVGTENNRIFLPTIKQAVEDLRSRFKLAHKSKEEDWGILGISLGGMIAMQWASDYPNDYKKMVIINSSSRELPFWKRLTPDSIFTIGKTFFEKDVVKRERMIIDMTSNLRKNDPKLIDSWVSIGQKRGFSKLTAVNQLVAAAQFQLPKNISPKMLVLTSRADRMVSFEGSQEIAKKYSAHLEIHPTAGHDIAVDDPQWIIDHISQWS